MLGIYFELQTWVRVLRRLQASRVYSRPTNLSNQIFPVSMRPNTSTCQEMSNVFIWLDTRITGLDDPEIESR